MSTARRPHSKARIEKLKQKNKNGESKANQMNKETTNYETDRPQVALENVDFYNDNVSWTIKTLVVPALILVYSIGLSSSAGAIENPMLKNRPNVAAIKIEVDPRVELIGIVFRLAGNYEFNQGRIRSYVKDIERQFGDFDGHPVVKLAARLRSKASQNNKLPILV